MQDNIKKRLIIWLSIVILLIASIVIIGGITRLTVSGLSITEWKPITGILPPLTEQQWQSEFEKYQNTPQFQLLNSNMNLQEFRTIFFWEYLHRLIARMIGIIFFIPLLFFSKSKLIAKSMKIRLWVGFLLGGLQGLVGWLMVKSGLTENTYVSHYRLAIHLILAFFIFSYLFWILLNIKNNFFKRNDPSNLNSMNLNTKNAWTLFISLKSYSFTTLILTILIFIQITWGALVAGLHAGKFYQDYPLMNGHFYPSDQLSLTPYWINFFASAAGTQFIHRWLAALIILFFFCQAYLIPFINKSFFINVSDPNKKNWVLARRLVLWGFSIQFLLGVVTLIHSVPISLGAIHQIGAFVLLALIIYFHFQNRILHLKD